MELGVDAYGDNRTGGGAAMRIGIGAAGAALELEEVVVVIGASASYAASKTGSERYNGSSSKFITPKSVHTYNTHTKQSE